MASSDIIPTLDEKLNVDPPFRTVPKCERVLNVADELLRHFWGSVRNPTRMQSIRTHLEKVCYL